MPSKPAGPVKTCSRGHKYTGPGGCPACWSGNKGKPLPASKRPSEP